jgi:hypothetical protein
MATDEAALLLLVDKYHRDGFLVFDGNSSAFGDHDCVAALDEAVTNLTNGGNLKFAADVKALAATGVTPNFTSGSKIPWVQYEAGGSGATVVDESLLLQPDTADRVRKLMGFVGYCKAIDAVVHDAKLIALVARLLDCPVDEVELFQDMALLKPSGGREKPWHQDKAYFDIGVETKVVGCWMAIDEATCENGCLRLLRGGHTAGSFMHFSVRDYQICDTDAPSVKNGDDVIAVPLRPGGLILFDGMIPHGTPTNTASSRRRALQFHWIQKGAPVVTENAPGGRAQIFGGTVKGLSC